MHEGVSTEVGRHRVDVVGEFTLGTGFGADGAVVASKATFRRLLPFRRPSEVSLGLVRLKPAAAGRRGCRETPARRCRATCRFSRATS